MMLKKNMSDNDIKILKQIDYLTKNILYHHRYTKKKKTINILQVLLYSKIYKIKQYNIPYSFFCASCFGFYGGNIFNKM